MLPGRQVIIRSHECADERGHRHRRPGWIHEAESDALDERSRLLDGADGLAIKAPLFPAKLDEVEFGHERDVSTQHSGV